MHSISLLSLVLAYLWGSLSPAFFVAYRVAGIDLRRYGSGNVGSSNVGEQLGRVWIIAVGFLDLVKGFLPAMLARAWGFDLRTVVLVGIATVIGHNWSLYLRFKGGRGIAATIGVLLAWDVRLAEAERTRGAERIDCPRAGRVVARRCSRDRSRVRSSGSPRRDETPGGKWAATATGDARTVRGAAAAPLAGPRRAP